MTDSNLTYYLALLALLIIGFLVLKKVASCIIKSVVGLVLLAVAVLIYWMYLR